MSEDSSSAMFAVLTTPPDEVQTTGGNAMTSSSSRGAGFYFQYAVVVIGVIGAAANALILYAMVASKEHMKRLLTSLYITRGKVSVRTSVTVGVASSVANDVTMRMTS